MIKINVGGKTFTSSKETLTSRCTPNYFSSIIDWNGGATNYIFIDRDPKYFNIILNHIRGYTVELPVDKTELQMIYEDAQYYGIRSLIFELERILELRLSKGERTEFQEFIKNKIQLHKIRTHESAIDFLDKMTDPELTNLKREIEKISFTIEQDKFNQVVFMGILTLLKYIEQCTQLRGISNSFQSRYSEALSIIKTVRSDSNSLMNLGFFLLRVLGESRMGD